MCIHPSLTEIGKGEGKEEEGKERDGKGTEGTIKEREGKGRRGGEEEKGCGMEAMDRDKRMGKGREGKERKGEEKEDKKGRGKGVKEKEKEKENSEKLPKTAPPFLIKFSTLEAPTHPPQSWTSLARMCGSRVYSSVPKFIVIGTYYYL